MYSAVVKENAVLSRSAVVNSTVPRLEADCRGKRLEEQPEAIKTRGDTW